MSNSINYVVNLINKFSSKSDKERFLRVMLSMILISILEALCVMILIPTIKVIKDEPIIYDVNILKNLTGFYYGFNYEERVIIILTLMLALYSIKIILTISHNSYLFKTLESHSIHLCNLLYSKLFSKNNSNVDNKNSSFYTKLFTIDINNYTYYACLPIFILISESIILLGLLITILLISPYAAITLITLISLFFITLRIFTKKRLNELGKNLSDSNEKIINLINETYKSNIEIILYDKFNFFNCISNSEYINRGKYESSQMNLMNSPRIILEGALIFSFVIASFVLILFGKIDSLITVLAVFAAAGFRLLPSVNRISTALSQINFGKSICEILKYIIYNNTEESYNNIKFNNSNSLLISNASYLIDSKPLFINLNYEINEGDFVAITGKSGAGKSTLLLAIINAKELTSGSIEYPISLDKNKISYVPQDVGILNASLLENIAFGQPQNDYDTDLIELLINKLDLTSLKMRYGLNSEVNFINSDKISGGERQRLGIARALYRRPQLLLLDESTSAIDAITELKILHFIKQFMFSGVVIAVAHRINAIEISNKRIAL